VPFYVQGAAVDDDEGYDDDMDAGADEGALF
jgi:hypothetical protein